jgi:hypothetical protein
MHGIDTSWRNPADDLDLELEPVVPPKINRLNPREYDRELYKRRNEVERLFRRLKGFRRIFSRLEKLDAMFTAFIHIALIFNALIYLNTPQPILSDWLSELVFCSLIGQGALFRAP